MAAKKVQLLCYPVFPVIAAYYLYASFQETCAPRSLRLPVSEAFFFVINYTFQGEERSCFGKLG